jgi:hexosaminidase
MIRPVARLLLLAVTGALTPAHAQQAAPALIPMPREFTAQPNQPVGTGLFLANTDDPDDRFAGDDLMGAMGARGIPIARAASSAGLQVHLHRLGSAGATRALGRVGVRFDSTMREEGYVLATGPGVVDVVAATAKGVFYGVQTLKQLIVGEGPRARLSGARIRDWPTMRWRGLHDDYARGPIPTVEFQKRLIRQLAAYKMNVYSPYFEHSFDYASYPLAAPPGGRDTAAEMRDLVAYARRYHIDVIPEQQTFGHLHLTLKNETYSALGETPNGHVLAPGQAGALEFVRNTYRELNTTFPGSFFHIGADETFELGRGQTQSRVMDEARRLKADDREGVGAVYIDFLTQIAKELAPYNRKLLFWGDVAMNHPAMVRTLPRDLIAVAWWYDPNPTFDRFLQPFKDAGMATWVAPGINNWNRVYPNNHNALLNIRNFVRDGQRFGSTGMLNTNWDDDGDALLNQGWMGIVFGAAAAWQPGESSIERFQQAYGPVFHGDTTGGVLDAELALIEAHRTLTEARVGDANTNLFWIDPWGAEGRVMTERMLPITRKVRLAAERAIVSIRRARAGGTREPDVLDAMELGARRVNLIAMKFQFAQQIAEMYARAEAAVADNDAATTPIRDLGDASGINGRLQDLRDEYAIAKDLYVDLWKRESRPYWLTNVAVRFDQQMQLWITRADAVSHARAQWNRSRTLPRAQDIGFPTVQVIPVWRP